MLICGDTHDLLSIALINEWRLSLIEPSYYLVEDESMFFFHGKEGVQPEKAANPKPIASGAQSRHVWERD